MDKKSFYDQIATNKRNSWILVFLVFVGLGIFMVLISLVIGSVYDVGFMFLFFAFATVFNIGYILYTYYKSDSIALKSVGAKPAEGEQFQQLRNIVEEMAIAGGTPMPKVYYMPSEDINAFATGRDPEHSAICVTVGCLKKLNREELQAVIAHEMTHIRNYDIRFVTLVAVMVGLVSIISQLFLRSMMYGGMSGGRRDRGGGNIALLLVGLAISIIAPLLVKLVQLSISRRREYMADAGAVELTRYPGSMIAALKKIGADYAQPKPHTEVNSAVAPMFLADPMKKRFMSLFQTHPSLEDRVKALEAM